MRFSILVVLLTACTATREPTQPPQTAAAPTASAAGKVTTPADAGTSSAARNFVCERFAEVNPKAICTPESTDEGGHHLHRARVAIDGQLISCVINDTAVSVVCDYLIAVAQQPPQPAPAEAPKTPAKGKK